MKIYKPKRGIGAIYLICSIIVCNGVLEFLTRFIDSYTIVSIIKIFMVSFTIYCLYYLILDLTLTYRIKDDYIEISTILPIRRAKVRFKDIIGYGKQKNHISGVKLSGIGGNRFAFGRSLIDKVGITYMYVPCAKDILYLKTATMSYGISPEDINELENILISKDIKNRDFDVIEDRNIHLHKDRRFTIPLIFIAIIVTFITLNPLVLYLLDKLPAMMPINFNGNFEAIAFVKGKEFAFRQMAYGVFNMIILVCMYYAAHFCAKYDKKSAYKYIYISLILALTFLFLQLRIIAVFA